jgi:hydrogenase maturation protease
MRIVIVGVGNSLRGDDSVGLQAVRMWQHAYAETAGLPGVLIETMEQPGPRLLELMNDAKGVVMVDAGVSGSAPGTVHRFGEDRLAVFRQDCASLHGWGIAEMLRLGRLIAPKYEEAVIRFVAIEAENLAHGSILSAPVRQALPIACDAIQEEVRSLLH